MIYRFCFDNKDTNTVLEFAKAVETLRSDTETSQTLINYFMIDWIDKKGVKKGFVDVMCPKNVFDDLFCWLKDRSINVKIRPIKSREV